MATRLTHFNYEHKIPLFYLNDPNVFKQCMISLLIIHYATYKTL